jgi:Stress responsive A/B Barrel Domain
MIERVQLLKLKAEHATPEGRTDVVEHALTVLAGLPGVLEMHAGVPADANASRSWDVLIALRFAAVSDVGPFCAHAEYQRFVDEFLAQRVEVEKSWSFEIRHGPPR